MSSFAQMINIEWISKIIEKMAFINIYSSFTENILSIPDIVYFLSITAAFLFLCVRVLEKRRWS
jgi:ABC-2 type transport system permease protein